MAMDANSRIAPAVHPLTGSSKPGADTYDKLQATHKPKPRPRPQVRPRLATEDILARVLPLIRREGCVNRRIHMLAQHNLLPDLQYRLGFMSDRMTRRIERWVPRLMAEQGGDAQLMKLKAEALIEIVASGWSSLGDELAGKLALSLAGDVSRHEVLPVMMREPDEADATVLAHRDGTATLSQLADIDFEAWDKTEFEPHTNKEWADLANPFLVTSRMAWIVCLKTKAELVEMVRQMPDEGVASADEFQQRLQETEDFFNGYGQLSSTAWTRFAIACATAAREDGEPEAQPGYGRPAPKAAPDRRAIAAYREWLFMEARLLSHEMYPEAGAEAERFIPATVASRYHFPIGNSTSWRDLPQPTTRAETMCRLLGIDWTTDEARDEHFLPVAPAAAESEAA